MRRIRNLAFVFLVFTAAVTGALPVQASSQSCPQFANCHCSGYGEGGFMIWCDYEDDCPYSNFCSEVEEGCPSGDVSYCDAGWCQAVCEPIEG